jgi:hypothetical protein
MIYEKIILRKNIYKRGKISSQLNCIIDDKENKTFKEFMEFYGFDNIMNEVLEEDVRNSNLEETEIYANYIDAINNFKDNEYFEIVYKIRDDMAIKITEHIYIYHLISNLCICGERLVPWDCSDGKVYICDSWWNDDDEILNDLIELSYMDFIVKYKAY